MTNQSEEVNKLKLLIDSVKEPSGHDDNISYEIKIVNVMLEHKLSVRHAMILDMKNQCVDISSILGIVDYLEKELIDLDKVNYFMQIFTQTIEDYVLE